jgi:hypothetical protein
MSGSNLIGARPSRLCGSRASRLRLPPQLSAGGTPARHTAETAVLR